MKRKLVSAFLVILGMSAAVSLATPPPAAKNAKPVLISLGPGFALDVSGDGKKIVGIADVFGPDFYWTKGEGTVYIGGDGNQVAVSRDGRTIIGSARNADGMITAAIWQGGTDWFSLGGLPEAEPMDNELSAGYSVSGDGSIVVGLAWDSKMQYMAHGFRWEKATGMTDLGSLEPTRASRANKISADGRVIVGWNDDWFGYRQGAKWVDGREELIIGPDGYVGEALGVNGDGSVIVGTQCNEGGQAWIWKLGSGLRCIGFTRITPEGPIPVESYAFAVNEDGSVIGGTSGIGAMRQAIVWFNGKPILLDSWLKNRGVDTTGWSLNSVTGVSPDGKTLVGWGYGPRFPFEAFAVQIP